MGPHFEQMLDQARRTGNVNQQVMALHNLAGFASDDGDYPRAIRFLEEAVRVCLANNGAHGAALSLDKLSDLYSYKLGDRHTALGYLEEAVRIAPEGDLKRQLSETLARVRGASGLPTS